MLRIDSRQFEIIARTGFVKRMQDILTEAAVFHPAADPKVIATFVAQTLDEAEQRGIRSERLLGMYVLLRLSDDVDPFAEPGYAEILRNPRLAEEDKAHLLQMIRVGELPDGTGG